MLVSGATFLLLSSPVFADEAVSVATVQFVRSRVSDAPRVRITGSFGCVEARKPVASTQGIWCERIEPCEFKAELPPQNLAWDRIDRVEVGRTHTKTGAVVGDVVALAAVGVAVYSHAKNRDGVAALFLPIAVLAFAVPSRLAGGALGALYGSNVVTWEPCYQRSPPPQMPGSDIRPPAAADSVGAR
jgi:hypothetical protein